MRIARNYKYLALASLVLLAACEPQVAEQKGVRTERSIVRLSPSVANALAKYENLDNERQACWSSALWSRKFMPGFDMFGSSPDQQFSCDVVENISGKNWRVTGALMTSDKRPHKYAADFQKNANSWCLTGYRLDSEVKPVSGACAQ